MLHELKADPGVFDHSWDGYKPFEIRLNDRNFQSGDDLLLRETKHTAAEMADGAPLIYTGRSLLVSVVMIPVVGPDHGVPDGWIAMTVVHKERFNEASRPFERDGGRLGS